MLETKGGGDNVNLKKLTDNKILSLVNEFLSVCLIVGQHTVIAYIWSFIISHQTQHLEGLSNLQ